MNRKNITLVMLALIAAVSIAGCRKQTIGEKIDDALDNRPAEKVQDKVEDVKDAVKDATN